MPWSQLNSWAYFRHPWLLDDERKEVFREYDKLRYSLVPYMYTAAYQAWSTGFPVMRALSLVFPEDKATHERLSQYMLGDSLLVGVFLDRSVRVDENGNKTNFYLPAGETWYDFFTGEKYEGGQEIYYVPPKGKGGALFVKGGSAIPFAGEIRQAIGDKPYDSYIIRAWGEDAAGLIYDDDGITFGYRNGESTLTKLTVKNGELKTETTGSYPGMPENVTYTLGEIIK
jgi:alpha-glucosidase (family GH31 glycosyl hydrolase)